MQLLGFFLFLPTIIAKYSKDPTTPMSFVSTRRSRYSAQPAEICISNISRYTERKALLAYFEQFGTIARHNFTSPTNGHLFVNYETVSMANACMKARPHHLDGKHLYVKRSLPVDDAHPRERFEDTHDLMIVIDLDHQIWNKPQFSNELRDYFSSYGSVLDCKRCSEMSFDYFLVEFADNDSVDQVILDKPHQYYDYQLNVLKHIPSNVEITNKKYASSQQQRPSSLIKDTINEDSLRSRNRSSKQNFTTSEPTNEPDLQSKVYRLQNDLKTMNEEFALKRKQLEEECSEQLKQTNESVARNRSLQQDLEQEHANLLAEYESLKQTNDALNEHYLSAELENFEITSYYEQILAEEKAQTVQLEAQRARRQKVANVNPSSPSSSTISKSPTQSVKPVHN